MIDSYQLRFSSPEQISRDMESDSLPKSVMAITSGIFKSAFPDGQPSKQKNNTQPQSAQDESEKEIPLRHSQLQESMGRNSILLISDVDFISDQFSVQKMNFLGQSIIQPINDIANSY